MDIDSLVFTDVDQVLDFILDAEEKGIDISKNDIIKEKFLEIFNHTNEEYKLFNYLVKNLGIEKFFKYFDIKKMDENNIIIRRAFSNLTQYDPIKTLEYVSSDNYLFRKYFGMVDSFYSAFPYGFEIDMDLLDNILIKLRKTLIINNCPMFLNRFSKRIKKELLTHEFKDENDFTFEIILELLNVFDDDIVSDFFQNNPLGKLYYKDAHILGRNITVSDEILHSQDFFDLLKSRSLIDFRYNINLLMKNNPSYIIDKRTNEYYDFLLNELDLENGAFKVYNDIISHDDVYDINIPTTDKYILNDKLLYKSSSLSILEREKFFKDLTLKKVSEIIIDYLFRDNLYNVLLNINEILNYEKTSETKIINTDNLKFYELIMKFDTLSLREKLKIFNYYKNFDISSIFYNDLRMVRDFSYEKIDKKLYRGTNEKLLSPTLSEKFGVPIYEFKGEPFYMLVKTMNEYNDYYDGHFSRGCFSLVGDKNLAVYHDLYYSFIYGFSKFDKNYIQHVFENDSFSSDNPNEVTDKVNRIMTADEIVNYGSYSEVNILYPQANGTRRMPKPDYLIVYDKILEKDIIEAKRLDIPINVIYREFYPERRIKFFDEDNLRSLDSYIRTEHDLSKGHYNENYGRLRK